MATEEPARQRHCRAPRGGHGAPLAGAAGLRGALALPFTSNHATAQFVHRCWEPSPGEGVRLASGSRGQGAARRSPSRSRCPKGLTPSCVASEPPHRGLVSYTVSHMAAVLPTSRVPVPRDLLTLSALTIGAFRPLESSRDRPPAPRTGSSRIVLGWSQASASYDQVQILAGAWSATATRDRREVASYLRRSAHRGLNGIYLMGNEGQSALGYPDVTPDASIGQLTWSSRSSKGNRESSARSPTARSNSSVGQVGSTP